MQKRCSLIYRAAEASPQHIYLSNYHLAYRMLSLLALPFMGSMPNGVHCAQSSVHRALCKELKLFAVTGTKYIITLQ